MHPLAQLDHRHLWHPFTQMRDWLKREPIVIVSGQGAVLRDAHGCEYLDANASIWTNLHGHNHPKINAALHRQLRKIAHSSALGLANEPASLLAARLVQLANPRSQNRRGHPWPAGLRPPPLAKVFFSDDGSTALEVALKLAYEFARRSGRSRQPVFLSLDGAYHGDTVGAVSLGHVDLFHKAYAGLLFKSDAVMAPYCYRCPFNRARPERADARVYRQCDWECVGQVEQKFARRKARGQGYAALVLEPLMQGAAGMIPQPAGWLGRVAELARGHGAQLIADEVMTGFGRTGLADTPAMRAAPEREKTGAPGLAPRRPMDQSAGAPLGARLRSASKARDGRAHPPVSMSRFPSPPLFACHHEGVQPDILCLAKGLTGGYLPMAATLTTQEVFDAFLGEYEEFKTFFHGHSFTSNQLGAAAALASLDLLESKASLHDRFTLERILREQLASLWSLSNVGDIRQTGLIAGVELVKDWRTRRTFPLGERAGIRVCEAMARRGVLTRPVGNVVVLMPPYCTTPAQLCRIISVLGAAIAETLAAP